jgi:hypothetical protein
MPSNNNKTFIEELKNLIGFLQTIWGVLAGISLFFPLSNNLVKVVPLAKINGGEIYGGLAYLSPDTVTVVSTIIVIFIMFQVISHRHDIEVSQRRKIQHKANVSAVIAILAFIAYLLLYMPVAQWLNGYSWENLYYLKVFSRLLCDIGMLLVYSLMFASTTRAFMLLGMIEFLRSRE